MKRASMLSSTQCKLFQHYYIQVVFFERDPYLPIVLLKYVMWTHYTNQHSLLKIPPKQTTT
jgi:hypothetical protein